MSTRHELLRFPGASGVQLAARLDSSVDEPRAYALFAHCFTCSKDLKGARWISQTLACRGIGVLRFDFTGLGESEGDFADTNFSSNLEDLVAAANFMRQRYRAPQILIGHSLGGAAALAVAHRVPEVLAVATVGAPSETSHLSETLVRIAPALEESDEAEVELGGRPFTIKKQLLDDLKAHKLHEAIATLDRALLVMHAPTDAVVSIDHAARIYDVARHPKSLISLDGADHLLSKERDARYAAELLAAWATHYVDARV